MEQKNIKSLESLSWFCHLCGLFSVFIGITVTFMNLLNKDFLQIQAGIYIFASGYALFKISEKISRIVNSERV
ncbi:MAG: hypothetical protein AB1650_06175 [Candidatus Omnitrophota bacterium]